MVAYKLGVGLQTLPEFKVFIGNGKYLMCCEVCRQVPLIIQEVVLKEDLYVLAMEGANIVLGIQWLETLGSVTTNYKTMSMEFCYKGKQIQFQGDTPSHISNGGLQAPNGQGRNRILVPTPGSTHNDRRSDRTMAELQEILRRFSTVSTLETHQPPWRPINHQILLKPGTQPINVHPYRYPHF